MKTFKVKNYKGNLVESLKRFSDSRKSMKIIEAVEKDGSLKIIAKESNVNFENLREKIYKLLQDTLWLPDRTINSFTDSVMDIINENPSNIDFEDLKEKIFKFLLDEIWAPSGRLQRLADSIVDKIKEELSATAEESKNINEANVNRVFVLIPDANQIQMPIAIFSSLQDAEKSAKELLKEYNGKISIWYYELDKYTDNKDHVRLAKTIE